MIRWFVLLAQLEARQRVELEIQIRILADAGINTWKLLQDDFEIYIKGGQG